MKRRKEEMRENETMVLMRVKVGDEDSQKKKKLKKNAGKKG